MKRSLLPLALLLRCLPCEASEWRVGTYGGLNVARLDIEGSSKNETKSRSDIAIGGFVSVRPNDRWSIEFRPGLLDGGGTVVIQGVDSSVETRALDLPLLLTVDLGSAGARSYLAAGVAVSQLRSAKLRLPGAAQDIKEDIKATDVGLRLGVGLRGARASGRPFIEAEFAWGFKDVNARAAGIGANVGAVRNRGFLLLAGASFGARKK